MCYYYNVIPCQEGFSRHCHSSMLPFVGYVSFVNLENHSHFCIHVIIINIAIIIIIINNNKHYYLGQLCLNSPFCLILNALLTIAGPNAINIVSCQHSAPAFFLLVSPNGKLETLFLGYLILPWGEALDQFFRICFYPLKIVPEIVVIFRYKVKFI